MNEYLGILYGIIQGLAEFLPISSSGHLALMPYLMQFNDPGVVFDLMMHLGTAMAVMVYYQKDIRHMLFELIKIIQTRNFIHFPKTVHFIVATIASVFMILLLKPISEYARNPLLIAFNLIFFGFILWRTSLKETHLKMNHINLKHFILIGLAQAIAIFPGVSRSGITISMSRYLGYDQKESGDFSFLLSLPIILAGAIVKLPEMSSVDNEFQISVMLVGVLSSFLVGLLTIHFFIKFIKQINFKYFFWYRLLLGLFLIFFILTQN
jgi:undecaprenyl-diphosphatase